MQVIQFMKFIKVMEVIQDILFKIDIDSLDVRGVMFGEGYFWGGLFYLFLNLDPSLSCKNISFVLSRLTVK